ncbi:MAG TPA: NAD(P)-dependent oxidoreductase [Bryobacteraceae bacterium]|nr:NAD(P)-dependent oxidoreductase [Bryobacteraceae bacterium]
MMRVLVTGGQGCIGAWVIKSLLERGVETVMFDTQAEPVRLSLIAPDLVARVRLKTGRIEDTEAVKSLIRDEGVTHIVHLAAVLMPFCQANPVAGGMINVIGTLNLFEGARESGRDVRIVYASSSAVWGPSEAYENRSLSEADTPMPATHYGVFKHANEGNARVFFATNGISSIGLRPWTVYGVGRDSGLTADPTLALRAVAQGEKFQIRLTGDMDLQYVEDVAEIFLRCLFSPVTGAHVFNLAGEIVAMDNFIRAVERIQPASAGLLTASGPQVPVSSRMDDTGLRTTVGEMPRTPLDEGIRRTLDGFRALKAAGKL